MLVGLIADTHGYAGSDVIAALSGCDHIIHAGDVGDGVLGPLSAIAPLTAVRGNNDTEGEAAQLPETASLDLAGHRLAVVHRLADGPEGDWEVLVFGHCHRQHDDEAGGRRRINPGAAGVRGFHRMRSVALLDLAPGRPPECRFVDLGPRPSSAGRRDPRRRRAAAGGVPRQ